MAVANETSEIIRSMKRKRGSIFLNGHFHAENYQYPDNWVVVKLVMLSRTRTFPKETNLIFNQE
jgi:hypothetical protein